MRVAVIDPTARGPNCSNVPKSIYNDPSAADDDNLITHRMLFAVKESSIACTTYILIYAYICAALLSFVAIIIYIMATLYVDRIIHVSLTVDKIETKGRYAYEESLAFMIRKDRMIIHNITGDVEENKTDEAQKHLALDVIVTTSLLASRKPSKAPLNSGKIEKISVISRQENNEMKLRLDTFAAKLKNFVDIKPMFDSLGIVKEENSEPLEYYTR